MYKKHALFDKIRICGIHQKTKLFYFSWRRVDHVYLHIMVFRDNV